MKRFTILGDSHGNINYCVLVANKDPNRTVIQLGDLGVGFVSTDFLIQNLPKNFKFFVGNHDNRQEAKKIPNCLGDFGEYNGLFFVSGADSIDKDYRTEGINWWPDEELTYKQTQECLDLWIKSKSDIIISHDCPQTIARQGLLIYDKTITRNLLDEMIRARKPKLLVFGHHHKSFRTEYDGIKFVALGIDEKYGIDI